MADNNSNNASSGVSILGLLGVAFVVLKLTHYIKWSWWWVTAPFWGALALVLVLCAIMLSGAWLIALFTPRRRRF